MRRAALHHSSCRTRSLRYVACLAGRSCAISRIDRPRPRCGRRTLSIDILHRGHARAALPYASQADASIGLACAAGT